MVKKFSVVLGLIVFFISYAQASQQEQLYSFEPVELFADKNLTQPVGRLEAGAPIRILQSVAEAEQVEITAWRKTKGFGRIWYHDFAKQITNAVFTKEFMRDKAQYQILESREDPLTGLQWQKVRLSVWMAKTDVSNDLGSFWQETQQSFKSECSVCHKQRDPKMHDANEWIAVFNGMVGFTDLDEEDAKKVLRYLQMNASDAQ
ncbi:trimethylamine-N-oxide reductase cytochrome c-type subunit TorC [Mesocricetibacter intestinalis]|uniref:Trimethylamine-N-oxide reductase cytochrome c-type subunit TorC n=1 Tax=Mesocricetibacter intestinalis TaxID=1521930 RepID=A0A4R6VH23_9PAST|nr:pentahemic C cytochrome [Mesocricetibacter intestinalis]TDQ57389.1 trimethylamine-N-oxide reductase cytochrome c-type subunit TorC [Mesocricetibacter intestinalis]